MIRVIGLLLLLVLLSVSVVMGQDDEDDCNTVRLCKGDTLEESLKNTAIPYGCLYSGHDCEGVDYSNLYICSSQNLLCPVNGRKCEDPERDNICTRQLICRSFINGFKGFVSQPIYEGKDTCCECVSP